MIPALLALPMVEGVVGQVLDTFSPSPTPTPALSPATGSAFSPVLARAASAVSLPDSNSPVGTMRADQWSQMNGTDLQTWAKSLSGRHVDATDATGRTISGVVNGAQVTGNNLEINIGGHVVSLSSLKQISWSPSV